MRRPLLGLAVPIGLGCVLVDGQGGRAEVGWLLAASAILLALALRAAGGRAAVWAVAGAAVALGAAAADVESLQLRSVGLRRLLTARASGGDGARPLRLQGIVSGDGVVRAGRLLLLLEVERVERGGAWRPLAGRALIEVGGGAPKPRILDADRVTVWARLRASEDGARDGLAGYGLCKSTRLLELTERGSGSLARRLAARLRERGRAALVRSIPPGPERALVLAMALGDRSEIDEATAETFRASGTYHVLALSGAQVALVAGLIVAALRWLLAPPWLRALVTTSAIAFYALLVGGDVPVVRAVLMAAAVLVGRALELDADAANLLGLAALVLLAGSPASVRDVGFQLSFGATLGILLLVGPLARGLPRLPLRAELALTASLAAQIAISPVLAASFHRLAPGALLLNIAAVPLSTAVLLAGLAVIAASALGTGAASLLGALAWAAGRCLLVSADLGPLAPWLDVRVPAPSCGLLVLYATAVVLVFRGRRGAGLGTIAAMHALLVLGPLRADADGRLHLTVIDVGQGDSLLLRSPSGRGLLIDTGGGRDGRFDPGERCVAPELWVHGLRTIDALVLTHGHPDHVGGAAYLLRAFRFAEIWEGPAPLADAGWRRSRELLEDSGATRRTLAAGMNLDWDGIRLSVLGPSRPRRAPLAARNEDSIVLDVSLGEVHLLLTGDLGGEAERALEVGSALVLKIGHHGSRSSSSLPFLETVRPRLALLSVGARNPFGNPHPEVLERCRSLGMLVLRTDRDGSLDVATDGRRLWVRTSGEAEERRLR